MQAVGAMEDEFPESLRTHGTLEEKLANLGRRLARSGRTPSYVIESVSHAYSPASPLPEIGGVSPAYSPASPRPEIGGVSPAYSPASPLREPGGSPEYSPVGAREPPKRKREEIDYRDPFE